MRFDRIAYSRPGAVGLNKADLLRSNPCIFAGVLHKARLRLRTWQRDAVGVSILIDRRPQDHPLDRIAIRNRSRKSLEQHHARAFAAHESVGGRVEGGATALGGEHCRLRKSDKSARCNHYCDATRKSSISASGPDVLAGRMDGGKRG